MNNKKTAIVSLVLAVIIVVLIGVAVHTGNKETVVNQPSQAVGAASPDSSFPYFSFGGNRYWGAHTDSLTQATTTVCALQSPAATSTLVAGSLQLDVSSTTATTVTIAKATTPYATTTLINQISVSANATANAIFASTTVSALEQTNRTFAPNSWVVVGMAGGVGTFSPSGRCQATWLAN